MRNFSVGRLHDELGWFDTAPSPSEFENITGGSLLVLPMVFLPGEDQISNLHEFDLAEGNLVLQ